MVFDDEVGEPMPKQEKLMLKKLKKELAVVLLIFSHFRRQRSRSRRRRRNLLRSMTFGVIPSRVGESPSNHV